MDAVPPGTLASLKVAVQQARSNVALVRSAATSRQRESAVQTAGTIVPLAVSVAPVVAVAVWVSKAVVQIFVTHQRPRFVAQQAHVQEAPLVARLAAV